MKSLLPLFAFTVERYATYIVKKNVNKVDLATLQQVNIEAIFVWQCSIVMVQPQPMFIV